MDSICIITGQFPPQTTGGAENYVLRTAKELQNQGYEVSIITTEPYDSSQSLSPRRTSHEGLPVWRFFPLNRSHISEGTGEGIVPKAIWHAGDIANPHSAYTIWRLLNRIDPDVIHTNNFTGISTGIGPVIQRYDARYVHTLHDYSLICPKGNLLREFTAPGDTQVVCESPPAPCRAYAKTKRQLVGKPDLVIGPSQHVIDIHRKHGFFEDVNGTRIQHGIRESVDSIPSDTSSSVLYVGNQQRSKGLESLFEAASETPEITVHLCGTGPYEEQSQEAAAELENVNYHGFVSDDRLQKLRRNVAAAVVPSIWMENSPLTIYESFAEGLPVIGADIGGIPELVDTKRGWLFPSGDAGSLADQMRTAVSSENESRRHNALEWAKTHSMERHVDRLVEAYSAQI